MTTGSTLHRVREASLTPGPLGIAFARLAALSELPGESLGLQQALADFDCHRALSAPADIPTFDLSARRALEEARRASVARKTLWIHDPVPGTRRHALRRMAASAALARLYIHHGDGYLREAALRALPDQPMDQALVATVMVRCNDWVPEVRAAALALLPRIIAAMPTAHLTTLLPFALVQVARWGRGGAASANALMAHPGWQAALLSYFMTGMQGPFARTLRQALAQPDLDPHLPRLATSARSAVVRWVAAEALLAREARWITGLGWRWIDKSSGIRRMEPIVASRVPTLPDQAGSQVLAACVADRAVPLRLVAADHLTRTGPFPAAEPLLAVLRCDRSQRVRDRMAFFDQRWPTLTVTWKAKPWHSQRGGTQPRYMKERW